MKTLIKIVFNKKFDMWEALTAATNFENIKLQKFGNDYNITGSSAENVKNKVLEHVRIGVIDSNFTFV